MSKETKPNITRRNVLAGIGATGAGIALGAHGVAAGENEHTKKDKYLPVAFAWQEALNGTDIDAFPDVDDDGTIEGIALADLCLVYEAEGIDDPRSSPLRTDNGATNPGDPIINRHGLKPGDQGETTLYYSPCSEVPANVWLKANLGNVHKKLQHHAMARVWYDVAFSGDSVPGDNVYQEQEPIIACGTLKDVLAKLNEGVKLDPHPEVASNTGSATVSYQNGVNYYAHPRKKLGVGDYEPVWITDDNIKQYVKKPKTHSIQNLSAGTRLMIPGVGYYAMDEEEPQRDLFVTIDKVLENKAGEVVGFHWSSDQPICRISVESNGETQNSTYNRAMEGCVLGPQDDDGHLLPITGFYFGACHYEELECHEPGEFGAIGFEWWIPDDSKLSKKTKMQVDFDFKAKPCQLEPPTDCLSEVEINGVTVALTECEVVNGTIQGMFTAEVTGDVAMGTQVRVFGPGGDFGADAVFNQNSDDPEMFTETSTNGEFTVGIGTGVTDIEYDVLCCPDIEPPVDGKEAKHQVSDE